MLTEFKVQAIEKKQKTIQIHRIFALLVLEYNSIWIWMNANFTNLPVNDSEDLYYHNAV